ncbi:MAG TPA: sterol desaturase family protein [Thermoanaerobaculia bacterium]|jgi:sterol desaturase/sphingolipid hydroxylase (fatty acid hydroxylase superfamily)|nr:sterol desaturase family protein [Thermoanaerobaculia bacterium]
MLDLLARHPFLRELVVSTLTGLGVYAVCALVIVATELRQQDDLSVYASRNALNDLAYAVFYKCSIYNILVMPLFSFLSPRLQFARVGLLSSLPPAISVIVYWIAMDFLNYWSHRLLHAIPALWAFHSVHHTQTRLTFLSANRIHAVEQLFSGVLMIIPAFLLGVPQRLWLPLLFLQLFSETLQHARLNWSFGAIHGLFVSPVFHKIHHSTDEREYNGNYGRVFSLWDAMFGTFVRSSTTARQYGVSGMDVPETLIGQFVHPFRYLKSRRVRPLDAAIGEAQP